MKSVLLMVFCAAAYAVFTSPSRATVGGSAWNAVGATCDGGVPVTSPCNLGQYKPLCTGDFISFLPGTGYNHFTDPKRLDCTDSTCPAPNKPHNYAELCGGNS